MNSIQRILSLSIARFNRMRRKPPIEILTYIAKRSKIAFIHFGDRLRLVFGEITLSDKDFFGKINLETRSLNGVKREVVKRDFEKAKKVLTFHMRTRETPYFFFDQNQLDRLISALNNNFPYSKEDSIISADEIVHHRFELLGQELTFGQKIDWHFAGNKKEWPCSFSPNIDFISANRPGDIKVAWELNRMQHLVVLGKAYRYTNDQKYAKEFTDELLSWISENPYKMGINWMEGIEVSIRLIAWTFAYPFFIGVDDFEKKAHFEFLKSIYMQTQFIERHLSDKWQVNNNHLIAEVTGLVMIGILFPEFSESRIWVKKGLSILEKELNKQILPDGLTWEYSTGYNKFVAEFLILLTVLLKKNNVPVPELLEHKLCAMIDFLNYVTKSDGMIPLVGDDDNGRAFKLDASDYADSKQIITLGSLLFARSDWPVVKSEGAFWLLGDKALTLENRGTSLGSRIFKDSGLFVMRDSNLFLLFVAGPQNPKYVHASHKHFDELSFVMEAYGNSFIVDSGTFCYFGDFEFRKQFKSRVSHNTSVIDQANPVPIKEAFEISGIRTSKILGHEINDDFDWVAAKYDGYETVSHVRHLFFVKHKYWLIVDFFESSDEHVFDLFFHFKDGFEVRHDKTDQSALVVGKGACLKIVTNIDCDVRNEVIDGEISPTYGVKVKAPILRLRKSGRGSIFATVLFPFKTGSAEEALASNLKIEQVCISQTPENKAEKVTIELNVFFNQHVDRFVCFHPRINNKENAATGTFERQILTN